MTVFSCRDCDWDGCKDCLNEAKRTASAEIKYDWWGDEEEEEDLADAAMGSDEYGVRTKFACAKGCTLTEARTSSASYQCDVCGMRLPASARETSVREAQGLRLAQVGAADRALAPWSRRDAIGEEN